jgi:hypothetical protein
MGLSKYQLEQIRNGSSHFETVNLSEKDRALTKNIIENMDDNIVKLRIPFILINVIVLLVMVFIKTKVKPISFLIMIAIVEIIAYLFIYSVINSARKKMKLRLEENKKVILDGVLTKKYTSYRSRSYRDYFFYIEDQTIKIDPLVINFPIGKHFLEVFDSVKDGDKLELHFGSSDRELLDIKKL